MARHSTTDIDVHYDNMNAHVNLSGIGDRMDEAQRWVEAEIVSKMLPVVPRKTGNLLGEIQAINSAINGSGFVRVAQSYGVYLYEGISRGGGAINWTNPSTQPRWGHYTIETYRQELLEGVDRIVKGKG